ITAGNAGNGFMLTISGAGIMNNSGTTQNFATSLPGESIVFTNSATAGNLTAFTNQFGGVTKFEDSSTAANATIQNLDFGSTSFFNSSTAANATITNVGVNSRIEFFGNSSGGVAALINANPMAVISIASLDGLGTTAGSIAGNGT